METLEATTPAAPEVDNSAPLSMDEAVQAYMDRTVGTPREEDAAPQAETPEQPVATDEAETAQAEEADAQDVQTPEAVSEEYEFDLAGHKVKLTRENLRDQLPLIQAKAKELEAGSQRKFQEAAEARKVADAMQAVAAHRIDLAVQARNITAEIQRLESEGRELQYHEIMSLMNSDPMAAQAQIARNASLAQLRSAKQNVEGQFRQVTSELAEQEEREREQRRAATYQYAQSQIKGWSQELDKSLGEYVTKASFPKETITSLTTDPRLYELAVKAYKYDALQQARPAVAKRADEPPKTLKPNSANQTVTSAQVRARDAWGKFEKSGKLDDAVDAYLARQRIKGR
jgi:hypothetical protein